MGGSKSPPPQPEKKIFRTKVEFQPPCSLSINISTIEVSAKLLMGQKQLPTIAQVRNVEI
jgi:hypothetical protein